MIERSAQHGSFTIERIYKVPPAKVFHAFADPAAKARWFSGPADKWKQTRREFDFRVGGIERVSGAWKGEPALPFTSSHFTCRYHDIVPDERIVYAFDMHLDERHISVSLATVELKPVSGGTKLVFTEQAVFLDGFDDAGSRERGTADVLDKLGLSLE
jgi:uncharacterized protein YndB with AHSA1/START domain